MAATETTITNFGHSCLLLELKTFAPGETEMKALELGETLSLSNATQ
jgi:hypothetical protein